MSNTSIMSLIVMKFPRAVCEKWHAHFLTKSEEERFTQFPLFIEWLISEKAIWECMVSTDVDSSDFSFHIGGGGASGGSDGKACFKCGEVGHLNRFCPKDKKKDNRAPRKDPVIKKFSTQGG